MRLEGLRREEVLRRSLIREQRGVWVEILFTKFLILSLVLGGDCGVVVTLGEFCGREVSVEFGMKGLALALRGEGGGCGVRMGIGGELCGVKADMVGVVVYGWLIVPGES